MPLIPPKSHGVSICIIQVIPDHFPIMAFKESILLTLHSSKPHQIKQTPLLFFSSFSLSTFFFLFLLHVLLLFLKGLCSLIQIWIIDSKWWRGNAIHWDLTVWHFGSTLYIHVHVHISCTIYLPFAIWGEIQYIAIVVKGWECLSRPPLHNSVYRYTSSMYFRILDFEHGGNTKVHY